MSKSKTVTFTLGTQHHSDRPIFSEGDKIIPNYLSKQRIKNREMVYRMLKKEYFPHLKVTDVNKDDDSTTLTVKLTGY